MTRESDTAEQRRLAGFSDDKQRLCFDLALWNGKDPILKERLFGRLDGPRFPELGRTAVVTEAHSRT